MVEEQVTVADLQKSADEITTAYGDKSWDVRVNDNRKETLWACGASRTIYAGREWMENPDLRAMRFQVAMQCGIWSFKRRTLFYRYEMPLIWVQILLGLCLFGSAHYLPHLFRGLFLSFFVTFLITQAGRQYADKLALKESNSERFLRKLLQVTDDPDAIRDELRALNATPEAFHTLDDLILDWQQGTPKPAEG